MCMATLYRKHELARALGLDSRAIARIGMVPTANGADGRPLFDLESAKRQLDVYLAGRKTK